MCAFKSRGVRKNNNNSNTHIVFSSRIPFNLTLTVIVVHIVAAVHLQRQRTIGAGPALDTHALVLAILQRTLAVSGAAVLAASCSEGGVQKILVVVSGGVENSIHSLCLPGARAFTGDYHREFIFWTARATKNSSAPFCVCVCNVNRILCPRTGQRVHIIICVHIFTVRQFSEHICKSNLVLSHQ